MIYQGSTNEYLEIENISGDNCFVLKRSKPSELSLLWFDTDDNQIVIDDQLFTFHRNQILCLTEFHRIKIKKINGLRLLRFNRSFYCIADHDSEVGCKGVLFFGSSQIPVIDIAGKDLEILDTVWKMFLIEMESTDGLQREMLEMMLKRVLILCTRIYKNQQDLEEIQQEKFDLVREFNYLVEKHYLNKTSVAEYAALLHKSPKTLSNIFKKIADKSPLQFIQERRMLEARRLLRYTDQPISAVGYYLGYEDIQTFSRFFKRQEGISPSDYRNNP